jgi:hypothetical protein
MKIHRNRLFEKFTVSIAKKPVEMNQKKTLETKKTAERIAAVF